MRVRNSVIAATIVAALSMSTARTAGAQGPAHAPAPPAPAVKSPPPAASAAKPPVALAPSAPALPGDARLFAPPAVIGEAWARTMRTVLDGMKHLVDLRRVEAAEALGAAVTTARPPPPPVTAWRTVWAPGNALREAVGASPWQLTPVEVSPATESPVDTRGEHAVLLGARMELPWLVP